MNKRMVLALSCLILACMLGCAAPESEPTTPTEAPTPEQVEVFMVEESSDSSGVVVAEDADFVPVGADAKDFLAFKAALEDDEIDEITLEKDLDITEYVSTEKTVIVRKDVTINVKAGASFYVDNGLLENYGTIVIDGAAEQEGGQTPAGVLAVLNGGGIVNAGSITLAATDANAVGDAPLGGQLRINGGTLENNGTIAFVAGAVANAGGVGDVDATGAFINNATLEMNGAFLRVIGRLVNEANATLTASGILYIEAGAAFDNLGNLAGTGFVNDVPIAEFEG